LDDSKQIVTKLLPKLTTY